MLLTDSRSVAVGETGLVSVPTDAVAVEVVDTQTAAAWTPQGLAASWNDIGMVLTPGEGEQEDLGASDDRLTRA